MSNIRTDEERSLTLDLSADGRKVSAGGPAQNGFDPYKHDGEERSGRIVLVDDKTLSRESYAHLIQKAIPRFTVAATEGTADAAQTPPDADGEEPPEAVACVLNISGRSVAEDYVKSSIEELRQGFPKRPVVILLDKVTPREALMAVEQGVRGIIPTTVSPQVLREALELVIAGEIYLPARTLLDALNREGGRGRGSNGTSGGNGFGTLEAASSDEPECMDPHQLLDDNAVLQLSPRQREVLTHLCTGASNKLIAYRLGMQESTVKVHVRQIMQKLNVTNRTQIALHALGALHHVSE